MRRQKRDREAVEVHVKGKNLAVTPALRDQVIHKMQKLDKYLDRLDHIDVELATEKARDSASHNHVEATTHVLGRTVRVTTASADMYAAVDEAVDKLYRQLNRYKEKIKDHHGVKAPEEMPAEGEELEAEPEPAGGADPIIEIERLEMKPMFEDEALEELRAGADSFYVFLNAKNEQVNVLYRRRNGSFGLIQPA